MGSIQRVMAVLAVLIMLLSIITGCGGENKKTITVYNWADYIDESVLEDFEKEYGIKVIYETFATNEDMYVKLKAGGANYDVLIPSDYMIERLIKEDMLQKIDLNNIPNFEYIDDKFKNLPYDP